MKCVGIVAKKSLNAAEDVFIFLNNYFKERGMRAYFEERTARKISVPVDSLPYDLFSESVDLVIVLGGDGTFIRAVRSIYGTKIPILGVNFGALGFLTEIPLEDMAFNLDCVLDGHFDMQERILLELKIHRDNKVAAVYHALNEVVFTKGALARIINLEATIDGTLINTFNADGLILSTPTGSTAYSLSAGGPIVYPTLKAFVLTPICPHTLTNRPIVLPDTGVVRIKLKSKQDTVYLTVDGQVGLKMKEGDVAEMSKAPHNLFMIQPKGKSYYEILRSKLKWGLNVKKQ